MKNIYLPQPVKILTITRHTAQEWSFLIDFKVKEALGKFVMLSLPGAGEIPISVSGIKKEGIELTIRNVGRATSKLFKKRAGQTVFIRGPYGNVFPVEKFALRHLLIIAGGSGVAAVKSVVEYFLRDGECKLKKLDLLFGFKSPRHLLFRKELDSWRSWKDRCNVALTVDAREDEDTEWEGKIGFVTEHIKGVEGLGKDSRSIVVGPPLMMANTIKKLKELKVEEENIWLSYERHMKCGVGKCGHCRIRDKYVCLDGTVFNYADAKELVD